jgi:hypothetical protein
MRDEMTLADGRGDGRPSRKRRQQGNNDVRESRSHRYPRGSRRFRAKRSAQPAA